MLSDEELTRMREADSARQGQWLNQGEADRHELLRHVDRLVLKLDAERDEVALKQAAIKGVAAERDRLALRLGTAITALRCIEGTPPSQLIEIEGKAEHWWYRLVAEMRDQANAALLELDGEDRVHENADYVPDIGPAHHKLR